MEPWFSLKYKNDLGNKCSTMIYIESDETDLAEYLKYLEDETVLYMGLGKMNTNNHSKGCLSDHPDWNEVTSYNNNLRLPCLFTVRGKYFGVQIACEFSFTKDTRVDTFFLCTSESGEEGKIIALGFMTSDCKNRIDDEVKTDLLSISVGYNLKKPRKPL